jgi:O-antigen ligase
VLAFAAAALPSLLAYNVSPSPTFLNQALALALWGAWVTVCGLRWPGRGALPLWAALALVAGAAAGSWLFGGLPASLALSAIGCLAAAAVLVAAGAAARAGNQRDRLFAAFCWAWVAAGVLNVAVAVVQVFLPDLPDGQWLAPSGIPGRAVGNLRQPNHLSSLLLWSCIAVVALVEMRRLALRVGAVLLAALVFAVVLTASRTGLVSVVLLALWGLLDRRLSRPVRGLLLAAPLIYALAWFGMAQWAAASQHAFGGTQRLAESDISSSRFGIWSNTLALIRTYPWAGVGFGEFNLAWTLTPFPGRPVAFFDHTHNLLLQLAVELGLPLAGLVCALLLWALARGLRNAGAAPGDTGTAQRCAMLMVLMIGLHSLLEYPLWYTYFLLPAAWAWGYALQGSPSSPYEEAPRRGGVLAWAGIALVAGAGFAVYDYARVAAIFSSAPGGAPLERRIADGQRSVFFSHHADYAAVTSGVPVPDPAHAFDRASHYLLDTRLMIAWAESLARQGDLEAARYVAARLREFGKDDAEEFFAACPAAALAASAGAAATALPFQCVLPARAPGWQAYLPHRPSAP